MNALGVVLGCVLAPPLLLSTCLTARYAGDETSPYYQIPAGSELVLLRELHFADGHDTVHIQDGTVMPYADIDRFDPYCSVHLQPSTGTNRTVLPDTFEVREVALDGPPLVSLDPPLLASADMHASGMFMEGDFSPGVSSLPEPYTTELSVHAADQPHVRRISCSRWVYFPPHSVHLSIQEIRETIDGYFRLRISVDSEAGSG